MASPKSEPWWVLWVHVSSWFICAPKVFQLCINQLVVWLCRPMWVIELLVNLLSPHPGIVACLFTLVVLRATEHALTPSPSVVFSFKLEVSLLRSLGVRQLGYGQIYNIIFNDKQYDVTIGNFLRCSCVYFVIMLVASLGSRGAYVQCKRVYHVL